MKNLSCSKIQSVHVVSADKHLVNRGVLKTALSTIICALCCVFATTAVFGQAIIVWNGGDGTGTAIGAATNWVGGVSPNSANGDICQWDNTVPGDLLLTATSANGGFNNGTPGVSFFVTGGRSGSWNLRSLIAAGSANIALNAITNDVGTGPFSLGDASANVLNIILRPSSSGAPFPIHVWANNSTNAATIFPNVRYQSGGGNPHTVQVDGTGDWHITNAINCANAGNNNVFLVKRGSGTMFWNPNSIAAAAGVNGIGSPIDIEGGRVVLTASTTELGTQRITNDAVLQFDAPASSQTLSGPMDGIGQLVVSAGTLTLSSAQSDWTGNIVLTNSGVLIVGGTQNAGGTGPLGTNSTISFDGGTLQFSVANTFDYSPSFSTANNQAYSFNTGGQNVTFTNSLTSSGGTLTKLGSGTLTLTGANTYSGTTTVGAGKLVLQGTTGTGAIVLSDSAALGVNQGGSQVAASSLTVGTSSSATLEFNNVTSTSTPAIAVAGAVSAPGPITINVNGGSFTVGQHYPLLSFSGTAPAVTLGTLTGAGGNLSTNGSTIQLNITSLAFVWSGLTDGNWDTSTTNDWKVNGVSQIFANGGTALFDDTVTSANTNVTVNSPASTTVNSSAKTYSITSSGANVISGNGSLTKSGSSTLTLAGGGNTYTGATIISGGTLSVGTLANGGIPSDIGSAGSNAANLVLNGGTLQLNATVGAATSDRLFTLGTANGTIDDESGGSLVLNNTGLIVMNGTGARTLTLKGNGIDELDAALTDNGGATSLAKSGTGTWVLAGKNTNSGTVTISAGTLQVGTGGASGSVGSGNIVDNGTLDFNTTSTLTNGTITGTGAVTVDGGGTIILPGNNSYSGVTTINAGTLQIGNGGASGTMNNADSIVDNDTLIYNSTSITTLNPAITGSGNVVVRNGALQAIGNNTYTGWTQIDPGATFQACSGPVGGLASSVVTNNGTLLLIRQDNNTFIYPGAIVGSGSVMKACNNGNSGDVTLLGTNTYTGGTFIIGGSIIFGDNSNPGFGSFVGDVFLTNDFAHNQFGTAPNDFVPATLIFNRPDDFVFPGNIVGQGFVTLNGSARVTLTANNTYTNTGTGATTTINAGTLQVGNGGASGSIGNGAVVVQTELDFDRSDSVIFTNAISGGGSLVQLGSGTLTLGTNDTYTGATTISNGTLIVNTSVGGDLDVNGGTLVADAANIPATLTVNGALNINSGTVLAVIDTSSPATNTLYSVAGAITGAGGTLKLVNVGPPLVANQKLTIFSQGITGTLPAIIAPAGVTLTNNLAVDGSVTVLTASAGQPTLTTTFSGGNINLSWPAAFTGLHVQVQTNTLGKGLSTNWVTIPGTDAGHTFSAPVAKTNSAVFFRLAP